MASPKKHDSGESTATDRGSISDQKHTEPPSKATPPIESEKEKHVDSSSNSASKGKDILIPDPYQHLSPAQADILRRQVESEDVTASFRMIYSYATRTDLLIVAVSVFFAIVSGVALPFLTVLVGSVQHVLQRFFTGISDYSQFTHDLTKYVLYAVYVGIIVLVGVYVSTVGFLYTGEHITGRIREKYLESCLRQNIGYYDQIGAGAVTENISVYANAIQMGISEKVPITLSAVATLFAAIVISFINSWKLTLCVIGTVFLMALNGGVNGAYMRKNAIMANKSYALGSSVVNEVVSSIRNAVAFGTQERLAQKYDQHINHAERFSLRAKLHQAVIVACFFPIFLLAQGVGFYAGTRFVLDGDIKVSNILTVIMALSIASMTLGNVAPNFQAFGEAVSAASAVMTTINRVSPLDPLSEEGEKLSHVEGNITLKGIKHIYPSRPDVVVMNGVDLEIPAGKTTALVGASGSGKSTIIGLVERFYDPVEGQVLLDGHDISKLNLAWLRRQVSLVQQEPTLFSASIYENIRYGLVDTDIFLKLQQTCSSDEEMESGIRELIYKAAREANAHDFITSLPEGYETNVGERGFLLSGGQKQRICIARAIISEPKILLLDEATSALDTKSEGVVQAALDKAAANRTTITIAHRLSTIRDADNIVVMLEGRIVEQGTHHELLAKEGAYHGLVSAQNFKSEAKTKLDVEDTMESSVTSEDEAERLAALEDAHLTDSAKPDETRDVETGLGLRKTRSSTSQTQRDDLSLRKTKTDQSQSSLALQHKKADPVAKYGLGTLIKFTARFNGPDLPLVVVALFFCVICGAGQPVLAVFYAKQISILSVVITPDMHDQIKHDTNFWCLMYMMLALVILFSYMIQGSLFAYASALLVRRARAQAFRKIVRQDIGFFDRDENTVGALTSFLSTGVNDLAGISGTTLGTLIQMLVTLVGALALSISIGWKLALVAASTMPLLVGCGFFRLWSLTHFQKQANLSYAKSAAFASESVSAIRAVASLGREADILKQYRDALAQQQRRGLRSAIKTSPLYAAAQSLMFFCFGLMFWYGGTLIGKREYTLFQFFLCVMAITFSSQSAGAFFSFAPDMSKSSEAATGLKTLFDQKVVVDHRSTEGEKLSSVEGRVEFRDVHFRYPTRPKQPVLRGLDLLVEPGQYVALVGASGCGKSTTVSLLERFYDALSGSILVDGHDISQLNPANYRSFIALVSQEPTLYQGTIRENIVLGSPEEDVADEKLEQACREANIYDFIVSLPDGFNTQVGSKGAMLSGGQRQRIAIARALIRDPRILLLDEATSALDSESEHIVQEALDRAAQGRTTIAVAHRLSTIQNADQIYVFHQGRIVERGTHPELLALGGRYAELVNLQNLEESH